MDKIDKNHSLSKHEEFLLKTIISGAIKSVKDNFTHFHAEEMENQIGDIERKIFLLNQFYKKKSGMLL